MNKRDKGSQFETIAVEYLEGLSYKVIERNFYSKFGEIDIIIQKDNRISAVEVKYRRNPIVSIFETISYTKINKIKKTLYYYLTKNNYPEKYDLGIDALLIEDINNQEKIYFIKDIQLNY